MTSILKLFIYLSNLHQVVILKLVFAANYLKLSDIEDDDAASKKYKCKYPGCDKVFRYRSEIVRHTVTHTNQRSYICPYKDCQKAFKRSDALATHLRIHTGDKPYKCPVGSCQLSFSTKAGLRYHVLKHKNDKIFRCEFAGRVLLCYSFVWS